MGTVSSGGRSCSTSSRAFLVSSHQCVQHRQTHPRLSGKFLEVGPRDRNNWRKASETIFGDHRIIGAHVSLLRFSRSKGVSPTEEHGGETECQDDAWCARHVPFLSEKT